MKRAVGVLGGLILLSPFALVIPVAMISANDAAACSTNGSPQPVDSAAVEAAVKLILSGTAGPAKAVDGLDAPSVQIPYAKVIVETGISLHVPARGQVIALATALQESGLRNLSSGDRDSLGLFQQRPSQGWGTPEQIQDPVYASTQFYNALLKVAGWQQLPVTQAAQAVQKSGFPDAYAKWESLASALQQAIVKFLTPPASSTPQPVPSGTPSGTASPAPSTGASSNCSPGGGGSDWGTIPPGALPAGYQIPTDAPASVQSAIRFALGQLGTPYQWGGTCTAPHGPDPMGRCDCSSLMQQAYNAGGVTLTRQTYTQVTEGAPVGLDALRPGDLLFMEPGPEGPEHVGMFIGSGLVVHAPHTGDVVRIAKFEDWRPLVIAARRVAA